MAIPVYQSQGVMGQVASKVSNVKLDNSGTMAALKAEQGLGNAILASADMLHKTMVTTDIMQANNDYNRQMNELQAKLYENKEGNARDNMLKYEEGRAKILDNIMKKGPSSMRDPMVRTAFLQTADKDWVNQQNRMRSYVMGEEEKHQDTQLAVGIQECISNITTAYGNDEILNHNIGKIEALETFRYQNYGPDKQKLEIQKAKGMAYGQAITAAMGNDDYDRAGKLLQGYGKYLDQKQRVALDKIVSERRRSDIMLNDVDRLFPKHGKNVDAAWNEISNGLGKDSSLDVSNYAQSQIGQNLGNNTCAIFVGKAITAAGGDTSLISTLADGTYVNYEERGLTFTNRSQIKDGDLVFWSVDGSGYEASNDKNAVNTNTHAYKGVTHVGIAKGGKVIQSGSHGISVMEIDTPGYHFVGAAHQPSQALSPTEKEKRRKEFTQAYMTRVNQQEYQNNLLVENAANQILALSRDGQPRSAKDYENIIYNIAGDNWDIYKKLMPLASHFGKGGGYHTLSVQEMIAIEDAIDKGISQDELKEYLIKSNAKPSVVMEYIHKNKKAQDLENKIDWKAMTDGFYEAIGGKDKTNNYEVDILKHMAKRQYEYMLQDKKIRMSPDDIVTYMRDSWSKDSDVMKVSGAYGDYRPLDLFKKGYYRVEDVKGWKDKVAVYPVGSDLPKFMTIEDFNREMKGGN